VIDGASIARARAKNIPHLHPWCGSARRPRDHNAWAIVHQSRTYGRKIFRPYKCGALLNLPCATIYGAAMVMVGRLRINAARPGEKYFARTSMVRRRVARARSQRAGDGASMAHVGAKYFSPV